MTDTNIPAFATTITAIPKRLRAGLHKAQHGRDNTMLIESEQDPAKYIGRLTKRGRRRYTFEAFEGMHEAGGVDDAKVISQGRTTTPLRGITLARAANANHKAE